MLETVVSVLSAFVLGIGAWAVTLNAKVSVLESRHQDLLTLIESKFDGVTNRLESMQETLRSRTGAVDQIPVILSRIERMERFFNGPFKKFAADDRSSGG